MTDEHPPAGHRTAIGPDLTLWVWRSGSGGPLVSLAPGAGMVGLDFLNVHQAVAAFTTSVLYDRAGTGWSDPVDLPRTGRAVVEEWRSVLHAHGGPPYVLIGQSIGGLYARLFAQWYPADVAGLLLLDPSHEDKATYLPAQLLELESAMEGLPLTDPDSDTVDGHRAVMEAMYATWPAAVRTALIDRHVAQWHVDAYEISNLEDVFTEVRTAPPLPDIPLVVLTAMAVDPGHLLDWPEDLLLATNDGKWRMHEALAGSVARGTHRGLDDAGHNTLHIDRLDAVLAAVRDLTGNG